MATTRVHQESHRRTQAGTTAGRRTYHWQPLGLIAGGVVAGTALRGAVTGQWVDVVQAGGVLLALALVWAYAYWFRRREQRIASLIMRAGQADKAGVGDSALLICPTVPAPTSNRKRLPVASYSPAGQRQIKTVLNGVTEGQGSEVRR